MKIIISFLFLASLFLQSAYAVKTGSFKEDEIALQRGRKATNVCSVHLYWGSDEKGKPYYLAEGTGALVEDNIVVTAGHLMEPDDLPKPARKTLKEQLKSGKPVQCSGFITFEPDVAHFLSQYGSSTMREEFWGKVFEIEAMMIHPTYNFSDRDIDKDVGFVKLLHPIKGITPLSLHSEKVFVPRLHKKGSPDIAENFIMTNFTGYGLDINWRGVKRTVAQIGFIEVDEDEGSCSSPEEISRTTKEEVPLSDSSRVLLSEDESNCSSFSDGFSSDISSSEESEDAGLCIHTYIPRVTPIDKSSLAIIPESHHPFYKALCGLERSEKKPYGVLYGGDSGGPLTIISEGVEYVLGVHSSSDFEAATDQTLGKRGVREFADVEKLAPAYFGNFCALFTLEGGLRPELVDMLSKLRDFKGARPTSLTDCLEQSREISEEVTRVVQFVQQAPEFLKDLGMLLDCTSCEEALVLYNKLLIKYAPDCEEWIPFTLTKDCLDRGELQTFKEQMQEAIESVSSKAKKFMKMMNEL